MEMAGLLSVLPPVLVVLLAITTKNIIFSLTVGIVCGLGVFACFSSAAGENFLDLIMYGLDLMTQTVGTRDNLLLVLFLAFLGGVIAILTAAGCTSAFAGAVVKRLKNKRGAQFVCFLMGCLIFIDDYFNAVMVGNVSVDITDKFSISRAKLAYLIDSTSAPVTILVPVSSWVAAVISMITPELARYGLAESGMHIFMKCVAFNFYAWFTLLIVVVVIAFNVNIGAMRTYEEGLSQTGRDASIFVDVNERVVDDMACKQRGTAFDLLAVLLALVLMSIGFMLYTGGFFEGNISVQKALLSCDPNSALASAGFVTLALCFGLFVARGRLSFAKFNEAFLHGVKSMVVSIVILVLSWTFSVLLGRDGLGTGAYIADMLIGRLPIWALPAAVFFVSALVSFSTGASWGAMGIMLPTAIAMCVAVNPAYMDMVLGATLAGAVFGDHCSPLADTTVLSASGAGCKHLVHVLTQLPYAMTAGGISLLAFLVAGITQSLPLAVGFGIVSIVFWGLLWGPKRLFIKNVCNVCKSKSLN